MRVPGTGDSTQLEEEIVTTSLSGVAKASCSSRGRERRTETYSHFLGMSFMSVHPMCKAGAKVEDMDQLRPRSVAWIQP
jgi:hypothetical protein